MKAREWQNSPMWRKQVSGFGTYLFAAFAALFYPVEIDKALRDTLNAQFTSEEVL